MHASDFATYSYKIPKAIKKVEAEYQCILESAADDHSKTRNFS